MGVLKRIPTTDDLLNYKGGCQHQCYRISLYGLHWAQGNFRHVKDSYAKDPFAKCLAPTRMAEYLITEVHERIEDEPSCKRSSGDSRTDDPNADRIERPHQATIEPCRKESVPEGVVRFRRIATSISGYSDPQREYNQREDSKVIHVWSVERVAVQRCGHRQAGAPILCDAPAATTSVCNGLFGTGDLEWDVVIRVRRWLGRSRHSGAHLAKLCRQLRGESQ